MINYYEVLEISENASIEVIKASYKTLVKKYHPDNCAGIDIEVSNSNMARINEAYQILSDEDKRKIYDYDLRQLKARQNTAAHETKAGGESTYKEADTTSSTEAAEENRIYPGDSGRAGQGNHRSCLWEFIKAAVIIILLFKLIQWGIGFIDHQKESPDTVNSNNNYTAGEAITPVTSPDTGFDDTTEAPIKEQPSIAAVPTDTTDDADTEDQAEGLEEDIDVEIIYGD
jgi:curved DNA-binding protein CbpA